MQFKRTLTSRRRRPLHITIRSATEIYAAMSASELRLEYARLERMGTVGMADGSDLRAVWAALGEATAK